MRLCYLNGEMLPLAEARVSVLDRGFLFGDGVYEVIPVYDGKMFAWRQHLVRLRRSLREIRLPFDVAALSEPMHKFAADSDGKQMLYIQITRGATAERRHQPPPDSDIRPTVFMMCSPTPPQPPKLLATGVTCITMEDFRWRRGNIKSVSLLAAALITDDAARQESYEVLLLRDGVLTEGSTCNYIIVQNGEVVAPRINSDILSGITCRLLLQLARRLGYSVTHRDIHRAELATADEIWLTSSSREIIPVTQLDGAPLGDGKPGEVFWKVLNAWREKIGQPAP